MAVWGWVRSARDFTGDADDDQHRSGGEQQPRATDGAQLAELIGDKGRHDRSCSDGWWASVRRRKEAQVAEVVQWAGEPQPTLVDDHHLVDGLSDLAEHVAGDQDGAALVGQVAQQAAQPRHAGRVEPVGRFVEQQHWRVAEQGPGQAEALAHAQRVAAHPPVRGLGQAHLVAHLRHPPVRHAGHLGEDPQVVPGATTRWAPVASSTAPTVRRGCGSDR